MIKLLVGPVQSTPRFRKCGVTVMVAVTGVVPPLVTTNERTSTVPPGARPMLVVLLAQVNEVALAEKMVLVVAPPLHTVWLAGWLMNGVGLTGITKLLVGPVQSTPLFKK